MKRSRITAGLVAAGAIMWLGSATAQPDDPYADPPPPPAAPPPAPKAPPPPAPVAAPAPAPAPAAAPKAAPEAAPPKAADDAEEKAPEKEDAKKNDEAEKKPAGGLPPGHPPIQPGQRRAKDLSPQERADLIKQMMRRKQEAQGQAPVAPPAAPTAPSKPKYPVDEHGYCIGDGPNDRPKDINLFHGWLGVNNEKAVPAPRPKGSEEWWKWRLTPHPYRYENHDDHCDPQNEPIPLIANIVNVGVLLFILVRFGRRPVSEALKKRKASIMADVERAKEIEDAAKKRLKKYQKELDQLDGKLAELTAQYEAEGVVEEKRARKEAAETRDRLLADAAFRVSQEGKTLRDELSRQALEDALRAADKLLTGAVTTADHDRLEEEYISQLHEAIREGGPDAQGGQA